MCPHALAEIGIRACVTPCVELDRGVAKLEGLIADVEVLLNGRERGCRRVGGDRVPVSTEQPMCRDSQDPPFEIPERDIDEPEQPDRELFGPIELPEAVPKPFPAVGSLTDELLAKNTVNDVGEHRPAPLVVGLAHGAVLRRHAEDGGRAGGMRASQPSPPRERRRYSWEGYQLNVEGCDPHEG